MRTAINAASDFAKIKPGFFINVNASSEQLEKENFVKDTLAILKEYDFPPSQLWIEITERCRDLPISMHCIHGIRYPLLYGCLWQRYLFISFVA